MTVKYHSRDSINDTAFAEQYLRASVLLMDAIAIPSQAAFRAAKDAVVKAFGESANASESRMAFAMSDMVEDAAIAYMCPLHADEKEQSA